MKALFFTDLHLHNWPNYATILPNGRNSRLQDGLDVLNQIFSYAKSNKIQTVLFGGDLFEVRKRVHFEVFNPAVLAIKKFVSDGGKFFASIGNHDQADKKGEDHSLKTFTDFACIMDKSGWYHDEETGLSILVQPYTDDFNELKKTLTVTPDRQTKYPIIMLHAGIEGAVLNDNDYQLPEHVSPDEVAQQPYIFCLVGHYHLPQELPNRIIYGGSPMPNNWGDPYIPDRGFIELDLEAQTYKRIPVVAPQFLKIEYDQVETLLPGLAGNYVHVSVHDKLKTEELEALRKTLESAGTRYFIIDEKYADEVDPQTRLNISTTSSYEEMVKEYVTHHTPTHLNGETLENLGLTLLKEATEESILKL